QEEDEADNHQNDADDVDVDAAAVRVDPPSKDRADRHQDEAQDDSHGVSLPPCLPSGNFGGNVQVSAVRLVRAPVAQWKSDGLLSRGSEVRILPGAFPAKVRPLSRP